MLLSRRPSVTETIQEYSYCAWWVWSNRGYIIERIASSNGWIGWIRVWTWKRISWNILLLVCNICIYIDFFIVDNKKILSITFFQIPLLEQMLSTQGINERFNPSVDSLIFIYHFRRWRDLDENGKILLNGCRVENYLWLSFWIPC